MADSQATIAFSAKDIANLTAGLRAYGKEAFLTFDKGLDLTTESGIDDAFRAINEWADKYANFAFISGNTSTIKDTIKCFGGSNRLFVLRIVMKLIQLLMSGGRKDDIEYVDPDDLSADHYWNSFIPANAHASGKDWKSCSLRNVRRACEQEAWKVEEYCEFRKLMDRQKYSPMDMQQVITELKRKCLVSPCDQCYFCPHNG